MKVPLACRRLSLKTERAVPGRNGSESLRKRAKTRNAGRRNSRRSSLNSWVALVRSTHRGSPNGIRTCNKPVNFNSGRMLSVGSLSQCSSNTESTPTACCSVSHPIIEGGYHPFPLPPRHPLRHRTRIKVSAATCMRRSAGMANPGGAAVAGSRLRLQAPEGPPRASPLWIN